MQLFLKNVLIFGCCGSSLLRGLSSSCGERRLLSGCGARASHCSASLVAEHGLWGARASVVEARRLGSCGSRAEFRGMWVSFPPRSETEPMSPALEGGFFTPEPPGKAWPCGFHFRFSVNSRKEGMASHCSTLAWRLPTDRGAWWGTVRRVAKSRRQLGD